MKEYRLICKRTYKMYKISKIDFECCQRKLIKETFNYLLSVSYPMWDPLGSWDGVVVIALASHLHGPGSGYKWIKLVVGSLLCSERFFSGFSRFPLSSKINIPIRSDLSENHFRVSGASWVNINNLWGHRRRVILNHVPFLARVRRTGKNGKASNFSAHHSCGTITATTRDLNLGFLFSLFLYFPRRDELLAVISVHVRKY